MAVTVTNVAVRATAETRDAEAGMDRLNSKVQKTPGFLKSAAASATGFIAATGIMNALEGAVGFAGDAIIGFNSLMEQSTIGFATMLGSGEKAEAFLKDLQAFAAKTPFRFEGLVSSSQRLLAMGFAAEEIKPLLTSVGDAMAALGQGDAGIDRATYALGQMRASARVGAQDMMQLTSLGIPAWDILAKKAGKTVGEVRKMAEEGAIDAAWAIEGLTAGMTERFGGLMERQATTFGGAVSTILDTAQILIAGAFKPIFDEISGLMQGIAAWAQSPAAQALGKAVAEGVRVGFDAIGKFVGRIGEIWAAIQPNIEAFVQGFARAFEMVRRLFANAVPSPVVRRIIEGVGKVFSEAFELIGSVVREALPVLRDIAKVVLPALASAAEVAAPFFASLLEHVGGFLETINEHGGVAKGLLAGIAAILAGYAAFSLATAIGGVIAFFGTVVAGAPAAIGAMIAFGTAFNIATAGIPLIIGAIVAIAAGLFVAWQTNFLGIRDIVGTVWAAIQGVLDTVVPYIEGIIAAIVGFVSSAAELIGKVVTFFTEMPGKVVAALREFASKPGYWIGYAIGLVIGWFAKGIGAAIQFGSDFVTRIVGFFQSLPGKIATWMTGMFNTIMSWFNRSATEGQAKASGFIAKVVEFFRALPGKVADAIKALPGVLIGFFQALPGRIVNSVTAVGRSIVTGIWSGISGMAGWLADQVTGFVNGIIDGVTDGLGISSPSKVFADIGVNMVLGLASGVLDEGATAVKAAESVVNDLTKVGQPWLLPGGAAITGRGGIAGALGIVPPPLVGAGAAGSTVNIYVERFVGRQEEADYYAARVAESLRISRET